MPKKISIHISETLPELESLRRKATGRLREDRLRALILIKQEKISYQNRLAKKLGYTEKTVREWLKSYSQKGLLSYLKINSGGNASSVISIEAHSLLESILSNPHTTMTSYIELMHHLEQQHHIRVNYMTLYGYCRRKFGSKLKVSRKSHYKKDQQAIEVFKKTSLYSENDKTKYK